MSRSLCRESAAQAKEQIVLQKGKKARLQEELKLKRAKHAEAAKVVPSEYSNHLIFPCLNKASSLPLPSKRELES